MTVKERIVEFIRSTGISINRFEREAGLSVGYLRQLRKEPSRAKLQSIIQAFPNLNPQWLLTGEGEMLVDTDTPDTLITAAHTEGNFRLVDLINIDSVGGMHSDNSITPSEQYIIAQIPFTEAREGDVAILQSGNSMYPTIPPGSVLLIRQVVDWREYFGYGGIFVLWLKDGRRITKEVRRYDADPQNYVWCVSYNPDVADEELPKSMIRGVWKVVKYIADFGW